MNRIAGLYILNNRVTPVSDSNRTWFLDFPARPPVAIPATVILLLFFAV